MKYSYCVVTCGILAMAACSPDSGDLADARLVEIDGHAVDAHAVDGHSIDATDSDATVISVPPVTTITSAPSSTITTPNATFSFISSQPNSTFQCSLDLGAPATCVSPHAIAVDPGDHALLVQAINAHGVVDPTGAQASWTYHVLVAGTVSITSGPTGYFTSDPSPSFDFTLTGDIALVACSVDDNPASVCTSPYAPGTLADGDHTVTVAIIDQLGGMSSDSRSFTLDSSPEPVWTQETPATQPGEIAAQAMVYDEARQQVLMVDGETDGGQTLLTNTWLWDGTNWTLANPVHQPAAHWQPGLAYDSVNQQVVLFGGLGADGNLNDTWLWDGTDWTQANPVHSPPVRANPGLAADPVRGLVVMFGGADGNITYGDTWTWDGTDWTQLSPATSPPARYLHVMNYDGSNIMIYGGFSVDATAASDTWTFDGTTWTQQNPMFAPPGRWMASSVFDAALGRTVMFGGYASSSNGALAETWEWTGAQWRQRAPTASPPGRWQFGYAYDELNRQVVAFGGAPQLADTWLLQ